MEEISVIFRKFFEHSLTYLPRLTASLVILIISGFAAGFISGVLKKMLSRPDKREVIYRFGANIAGVAVFLVGFAIALEIMGLEGVARGIVTSAGLIAIVLGFAFRNAGENLVAGIMLAFSKPFDIGDTIETAGHKGRVVDIDLRRIHLETEDGKDVYLSNAQVFMNPIVKINSKETK